MKSYLIKKISNYALDDTDLWDSIEKVEVDSFPWDNNGYRPKTEAAMIYTDSFFRVKFTCCERTIKADYLCLNDPVWRDSCAELFFMPSIDSEDRYMNFEMNPIGTLLLGFGRDRNNRTTLEVDSEIFNIKTTVNKDNLLEYAGEYWSLQYDIPFEFLQNYFGRMDIRSGMELKGNFYKCGDDTVFPHYGCWNYIDYSVPDFHKPEFFGSLTLE